ncbi:MAG TPA: hypothetical protein VKF36_18015 [Syntrophorhabdales bacterium]|nr:hypothetical protein [Syntrophorhabdales bacterium]
MAQDDPASIISIAKPDGTNVLVPLSGPLHNETAEKIAREIQSLDKLISSRNVSPTSQAETALLTVARDSRNDALRELDAALRIAQQTSAGQLDEDILRKSKLYASSAREALRSPIPSTITVATQITTSIRNATLHYISKLDYDLKSQSWMSYSEGESLRIGRYVFRVDPCDVNLTGCEELVMVISDPTKRHITPIGRTAR